jgi:hypothetical protein
MYEDTVKSIDLNADELELLIGLLENYDYSSTAENLLISGLIDKLSNE